MKIQSNNPFPQTPQRWDEGRWIYYYNIKDNGPQEEGSRYEAEFVIIESLEQNAIDEAIARATLASSINQLIVDNIQLCVPTEPTHNIKVSFNYRNAASMLQEYPYLSDYIVKNAIPIIYYKEGVTIYLSELYDEHRSIFIKYNAEIV